MQLSSLRTALRNMLVKLLLMNIASSRKVSRLSESNPRKVLDSIIANSKICWMTTPHHLRKQISTSKIGETEF
jgi:hypothetical protein